MGPELPDSPQLPRPLPILHEEGPALLQGCLRPAQDQKKPEEAIIPNEMRGTWSERLTNRTLPEQQEQQAKSGL